MLPDLSFGGWAASLLAAFCAGLAKAGILGVGMLSVVLMAMVMDARSSTGLLLLVLVAADIGAVWIYRRNAKWRVLRRIIPPALAGVIIGYLIMGAIPAGIFSHVIGWIVLSMAVLHVINRLFGKNMEQYVHGHGFAWPMGLLGGITTMLANAAGPIMTLYFLALDLPKMEFVGTVAWFFFLINLFKIPFSIHLGIMKLDTLPFTLLVLPAMVAGMLLGQWIIVRIPQRIFEILVISLSAVGGLKLILS